VNGPRAARLPARRALSPSARRAVLTAHIIVSVGLLGDSAGFLAVAVRGVSTGDPELADASWTLLEMFSFVFGIPLSFAALITGVTLGLGTSWGVLRYPWTSAKLLLVISVMVVGTLVLPSADELRSGSGDPESWLIAGAAYDVVALSLATGLAVYKPGRRSWLRRLAQRGPTTGGCVNPRR
jgi:hypothetical protein